VALKKGKPLVDWAKGTQAAPGRPKSNVGQYLIKPVGPDRSKTGFEMLEHAGQADPERPGQLRHRRRAVAQPRQHPAADRVRQRLECAIQL